MQENVTKDPKSVTHAQTHVTEISEGFPLQAALHGLLQHDALRKKTESKLHWKNMTESLIFLFNMNIEKEVSSTYVHLHVQLYTFPLEQLRGYNKGSSENLTICSRQSFHREQ